MVSSIISPRLVKRLEIGTITNEDLYELSKHIYIDRKADLKIYYSDISHLLLHLSNLIKDLKHENKWRKRLRLIKKIFNQIHIENLESFSFPSTKDNDFCISIPFKFSHTERAKDEFLKYISLNIHGGDYICYFSNIISNLSEQELDKSINILIKNIRRNYKNSIWNLYYFISKTNHNLSNYFKDLIHLLREVLIQDTNYSWQESKSYPNFECKKGLLTLTCIQKLISIVSEDEFIKISTDLLSNLSGSLWNKSVDCMIVNLLSKRMDKCDVLQIFNFHNYVYSILSSSSYLSNFSIDLLGSIVNNCILNKRDCSGCNKLLDLLLNFMFKVESDTKNLKNVKKSLNIEKYTNINLSSIYAISTIPINYINGDFYEKIESYIQHISSKPSLYNHEIILIGNNKIINDNYLNDIKWLERFNPIKLLCLSIFEYPFPSNLSEKILEIRLSINILKSINKPEHLPFYKKWEHPYKPSQFFKTIENILNNEDSIININVPKESNPNINFYDNFLFNGELTSKGQRELFESEINSFIFSIRYLLPQIARSLALELLWVKGNYLNLSSSCSTFINFIDKIINKIITLFPDPNFNNLCNILTLFNNPVFSNDRSLISYNTNICMDSPIILDINESSELITRYCESNYKLDNIYVRFILLLIPMVHGNDILLSIIGNCFEIISQLSSLSDDDIALYLSDNNDIFVPSGMYIDKSIITGEKRENMLREQQKTRDLIGNRLLKVEKYFFILQNAISSDITGDTVDLLLKLIKESLVISFTRKYSTLLLTRLTQTILLNEDKSINIPISSWRCIVEAYLRIHSLGDNTVKSKGIDKLLMSISNKRISRPLASLLLPIPMERLKMIKSNFNNQIEESNEITCALAVLSSQLKQRLDLPVSMILGTLCQIVSDMGEVPVSGMIDCIIELAFYPMDQQCIEILSNYILSPSSQLRYAISLMISKRRDFLPQLYKYLKILVYDSGPASIPSRNVSIFYRQSRKVSRLDPSEILDIKYDNSLQDTMPLMIGETLSMTYFEGDSTFSELILILTARYISSNPPTRLAILYTIINLFKNGKNVNEKYNPSDVEIILKFIITVVLQQAKNISIDELELTSNSNSSIVLNALLALENLVMSEKVDIKSLQEMIDRLSSIITDSSGTTFIIITRSCNLLKAILLVRTKSTIKKGSSLIQLVNGLLNDRHEMDDIWTLFYGKTFASISKFEDKQSLLNLFELCFNRMNKLIRGEKLEVVIQKSTLMASSFIISMDLNSLPLLQIIDNLYNGTREEKLRSLSFIINLNKINIFIEREDILLKFFNSEMRSKIVLGLFPLLSDSYVLVKNLAMELCKIMSKYDTEILFELISNTVLNPDSSKKYSLGAIKFANLLINTIKNSNELTFNIEFLVEACLDSNSEIRSASINCLKTMIDNLNLNSFPMNEFKDALITPTDGNIQLFLERIQSIHNVQFSLIEPILKRSVRSRNRKIRILTLNYLNSYNLQSIDSLLFHPLLDLDDEEVDLICKVMNRMKDVIRLSNPELINLYKESTISKCSPLERFCYSKILSNITEYDDIKSWSYTILTTNSPYYKIHGILMLFTNLNPNLFSNELDKLLEITSKLFNHEHDIVREGSLELFQKLIKSFPDDTNLFIRIISNIFENISSKTAPSRDLALMIIPNILILDENNPPIKILDYSNDRDILYSNVYLSKFDVSPTIAETADHVWRKITFNTKTVLRNILPRLLNILSNLKPCEMVESCIESIITIDGDATLNDSLIGIMLDHLIENKYIYLLKVVISHSNKNALDTRMNEICKLVKDSCSSKDSAMSIETLGLLSKWVKTVMDDSLIDLFEAALQDSTSPSFKTLNNLSIHHTKLINAWKLVRPNIKIDDFWIVAELVISKCPQNISELYNTFLEIINLYNYKHNDLIHIPISGLFWNFGIRGPEFIFDKRNELSPIMYKSIVKSVIECAPSKTLVIELAPVIISTTISDFKVMQSLFESTDLPQHQGILIILIAQSISNDTDNNIDKLNTVSQFLVPTIISYLTQLTSSNPSSLGLSFNTQIAYSISFIMKMIDYKFIQSVSLRLCGLIIRASGDWSNLLYKASLLSSLYHLIKSILNGPNALITLRPIIPQLLGLLIKSFGTSTYTEKPELPFSPSYPTFTVSTDPCHTFSFPQYLPPSFKQSDVTPSPITFVRHSSLALFQMVIPHHLERSDLAFNELLKVSSPGCPPHSLIAFEYLINLKDSEEQILKLKHLYEKNIDDRLNPLYNRVIASHIKSSNNINYVDLLVQDIITNHPSLESGMIFSQLDSSLLLIHKDKIFSIYKMYCTHQSGDSNIDYHCKTIAINIFEQAIDPCFDNIAIKLLQIEVSYGTQTSCFLLAIEKLILNSRNYLLQDEISFLNLLKLLYNCIFGGMALRLQSDKILLSLVDSKPLIYYLKDFNYEKTSTINEVILKLDNHITLIRKDRHN